MRGFLYVLSNPALFGLYKVGFTTRTIRERLYELSCSTSVPMEFKLEFFMEVDRAHDLEGVIHDALEDFHYNKEYFKCELIPLVQIVKKCASDGRFVIFGKGGAADELTYSDSEIFARVAKLESELEKASEALNLANGDVTAAFRPFLLIGRLQEELTEARYESYRRRFYTRREREIREEEQAAAAEEARLAAEDQRRVLEYHRLLRLLPKPAPARSNEPRVSISAAFVKIIYRALR